MGGFDIRCQASLVEVLFSSPEADTPSTDTSVTCVIYMEYNSHDVRAHSCNKALPYMYRLGDYKYYGVGAT